MQPTVYYDILPALSHCGACSCLKLNYACVHESTAQMLSQECPNRLVSHLFSCELQLGRSIFL